MFDESLFRALTALYLVGMMGTSAFFRIRAERRGGKLRTRDGIRAATFARVFGLVMIAPLLGYLAYPPAVAWARLPLPNELRWAAGGLLVIMAGLVLWMLRSLGDNISPVQDVRSKGQLVTHGPYRYIRHPLYVFGMLTFAGLAMFTATWWLAACLIPISFFIMKRVTAEETKLVEAFGSQYHDYMRRTGRFVPHLSRS